MFSQQAEAFLRDALQLVGWPNNQLLLLFLNSTGQILLKSGCKFCILFSYIFQRGYCGKCENPLEGNNLTHLPGAHRIHENCRLQQNQQLVQLVKLLFNKFTFKHNFLQFLFILLKYQNLAYSLIFSLLFHFEFELKSRQLWVFAMDFEPNNLATIWHNLVGNEGVFEAVFHSILLFYIQCEEISRRIRFLPYLESVNCVKRHFAGNQFPENNTKGIDVAGMGTFPSSQNFLKKWVKICFLEKNREVKIFVTNLH